MKQIWSFREGKQIFVSYAQDYEQMLVYWKKMFGEANKFIRIHHTCDTCDNKRERNWCSGRLGGCDCNCHVWDWQKPIELSPVKEGK